MYPILFFLILIHCLIHVYSTCHRNPDTNEICSHKGNCDGMACDCFNGYEGYACHLRKCPLGKAWSDKALDIDNAHNLSICSNRGTCDQTTGTCQCHIGFEGKSCNRLACPNTCGGHGRCIAMDRYAKSLYNMIYDYWDGDMIYGCVCDYGYEGHDCSLRSCPTGDDVMTTEQVNEIQYIKCDTEGAHFKKTHFYIGFKDAWSIAIKHDDTADIVQEKMNDILTLDEVEVTFENSRSDYACSDDIKSSVNEEAQIIKIQFLRQFWRFTTITSGECRKCWPYCGRGMSN